MKIKSILTAALLLLLSACNQQADSAKDHVHEHQAESEGCVCAEIYAPVCGSDGKTYSNACEAECHGMEFTEGECAAAQ